jgi:hypothetical protein
MANLNLLAQDTTAVNSQMYQLTGEVKNSAMVATFKNMTYKDVSVSGEIKPNLSSTKYQISISGNDNVLKGDIGTRELKWTLNLDFNGIPITGEMKIPLAGESYKWNVIFLGNEISGGIKNNISHTKTTFNLQSENMLVTGEIKEKLTSVAYSLKINGKSVKGTVKTQMGKDLTYKLELDHLNKEELAMFFLIESMRIISLDLEATDKFQNGGGF